VLANTSSVHLVLGGGQCGNCSLLLTSIQYATLSTQPLVSPINQGPSIYRIRVLNQCSSRCKERYALGYSRNGGSGKNPHCSLIFAVQTDRYGNNVLAVLQHILSTYGQINPQQLKTREMEICNMHFHMTLQWMQTHGTGWVCTHAHVLYSSSESHLCSVFKKPHHITGSQACNHQTAEHCTWENMKVYLRDAQKDLLSLPVALQIYPQAKNSLISAESLAPCHQLMIISWVNNKTYIHILHPE